jgi:hypothetical protein
MNIDNPTKNYFTWKSEMGRYFRACLEEFHFTCVCAAYLCFTVCSILLLSLKISSLFLLWKWNEPSCYILYINWMPIHSLLQELSIINWLYHQKRLIYNDIQWSIRSETEIPPNSWGHDKCVQRWEWMDMETQISTVMIG